MGVSSAVQFRSCLPVHDSGVVASAHCVEAECSGAAGQLANFTNSLQRRVGGAPSPVLLDEVSDDGLLGEVHT